MKKVVAFLLVLLPFQLVYAQTNIYHPFPVSNAEWREVSADIESTFEPMYVWDYHYWLNGDTSINGLNYHKLYNETTWDEETFSSYLINSHYYGPGLRGAIREDSLKRIYFYDMSNGYDTLLYDFGNLNLGSSIPLSYTNTDSFAYVSAIDSILIDSTYRKRYEISDSLCMFPYNNLFLIEGIGATTGLLNEIMCDGEELEMLTCYKENNELLFVQYFYTQLHFCYTMVSTSDPSPPGLELFVSPNPVDHNSIIQIRFSNLTNMIPVLKIYNAIGMLVATEKSIDQNRDKINFDCSNLKSGIYFCSVNSEENEPIGFGKIVIR